MANSIRTVLSKESLLAEIKMQLSAPANANKAIIIFEGTDDIAIFNSLLSDKNCLSLESYGGKQALEEIINCYIFDYRVIGIRDKDYLLTPSNNRIFFCDHCNLEMMIISDLEAFNHIMYKITQEVADYAEFRNKILISLILVSAARKANDENIWGINFQNISIDYLLKDSDQIVFENLVFHLNNKSDVKLTDIYIEQIKQTCSVISDNLIDYTNGHDFCAALCCFLKKYYSKKPVVKALGKIMLHLLLSMGYNNEYFKKTNLYASLQAYQDFNNLKIVR